MAEPEVAEIDDGYGLRNLAWHLVDAGRIEDLHLAEEGTDAELAAGRPATSLGRELRYALMIGCAGSATDPVPGALGLMLIEAGIWDITRALAHVRRRDAIGRCAGLVELLPVLTAQQRPVVLAEVLTAAAEVWTSTPDSSASGQALEAVAPT